MNVLMGRLHGYTKLITPSLRQRLARAHTRGLSPSSTTNRQIGYFSQESCKKSLIKEHTTPSTVCGIHLNLITSNNDIYYMQDDNDLPFPSPYWGFVWPGGLGLTRYIVENSIIFKNKRVLDVGSGCGVSSIAAAQAGAKEVVANDICPYAHDALLLNMELNSYPIHNSTISFCEENLIFKNKEYFDQFDVILCGDMLYDADFSRQLMNALCQHEMVIFGDPERTYCPEKLDDSNSVLATYDYQCDGFASLKVFRLNQDLAEAKGMFS